MSLDSYIHRGYPIECFIRIKPEPYQRQDLKSYENKISLMDQYDMPRDEFISNGGIFEQPDAFRINYNQSFSKYISALVQGVNSTLFNFGSKGSGKTFAYEGNTSEGGLYSLLIDNLFYELDSKRAGIYEEADNYTKSNAQILESNFSYKVKMKYIEITNEGVVDLLQKFNYYKQPVQVTYSESEGYNVSGAAWVTIQNVRNFPDIFTEALKFRTHYDFNNINKSTTMMLIDVEQLLETKTTKNSKFINSKLTFWDMPSADILSENFRSVSNNNEYKALYAFHNMVTELSKSQTNVLPTIYENSIVTKLMKEQIGGNGLCAAVFTLQHSNYFISNIVFKIMKIISNIQTYPVTNNSSTFSIFKKYRVEIAFFNKFSNTHQNEIRPPFVPKSNNNNYNDYPVDNTQFNNMTSSNSNINPLNNNSNYLPVTNNLNNRDSEDLMYRIKELQEMNLRLKDDLKTREDEVISLTRKQANMELKYNQVQDLVDGDRYDVTDKLAHIENDINENNEIMITVDKLHAQLREEKERNSALEDENQNLRNNATHLSDELNKLSTEFSNFKTNTENEMYNLKELLNATKNELDFSRNEADKYKKIQSDLLLEIDEMNANFKRQLEDKEREIELKMLELAQNEKRKLESELREVTRKVEDLGQENGDLNKVLDEIRQENNVLKLQNDEMRSSFREFLYNNIDDEEIDNEDDNNEINKEEGLEQNLSNLNHKGVLLKTYYERESQLLEQLAVQKALCLDLKEKLRKMKMYGRKVRNIALDYFPINENLPEIMTKEINVYIEEAESESLIQFLEFEKETLRKRNSILEIENQRLKDKLGSSPYEDYKKEQMFRKVIPDVRRNTDKYNSYSEAIDQNMLDKYKDYTESDIQKKIYEELLKIKCGIGIKDNINNNDGAFNNANTLEETNKLKKEIDTLKEENNKLRVLINETSLRDPDNYSTDNPKAMHQQIQFQKNQIQQLESERAELLVRASSAEEQLKNIMKITSETNQNYNKKILELSKRLEAAEMKANRYDRRLDQDFYDNYNNYD